MEEAKLQALILQSLAVANNYVATRQIQKAVPLIEQVRKIDPENPVCDDLTHNLFSMTTPRDLSLLFGKEWRGGPLEGRSIEIFCDQGMGDVIQLLRYVKLLKSDSVLLKTRCSKIVLNCYPHFDQLARLVGRIPEIDIFTDSHIRCDYHTNIMGLPALLSDIRLDVYYPAHWKTVLSSRRDEIPPPVDFGTFEPMWTDSGLKVGLAWHSNLDNDLGFVKSIPLAQIAALEDGKRQLFSLLPEEKYNFLTQLPINDMEDTARIVANMDVVVSVDTAVLHLAGSMGKKTLALLPYGHHADPRWETGNRTVWYPSVEIFRQTSERDWRDCIEQVKNRLDSLSDTR